MAVVFWSYIPLLLCIRSLKLKLFRGPNEDIWINPSAAWWLPEGCITTLTQQWRYRDLTRYSFYMIFPAKGYKHVISSRLYVCWKGTRSLAGRALSKPVKKLNNLKRNYSKIPKTSRAALNALAGRVFETLAVQYMRTACTVSISRRDSVPWRSFARPPKIWLLGPF